jgi:hypothetical protein
MSFEEYMALDAVNWSSLKHLRVSPKHYRHALKHQRKDTAALKLGRAVHTAVFESDRLVRDYVLWDGGDRRGKAWTDFKAVNEGQFGRTILKVEEYERACAIRDAVRAHPLVPPLLAGGQAEHAIQWTDEKSGLACKARLDMLSPLAVLDLKTSRHAVDARLFASGAWGMGYFHQLAFYARGARAVTGKELPAVLIAVENTAPFDVCVYEVDEDDLWLAGEEVDRLLALLVECRASGLWPGVGESAQVLAAPRWAHKDVEDMGPIADPSWMEG